MTLLLNDRLAIGLPAVAELCRSEIERARAEGERAAKERR